MRIIQAKDFQKARHLIKSAEQPIIFTSEDDELNRKILEKEKIAVLLINQKSRKDYQKQRNSGFNQVMAKLAKKNKIIIGINLDELINSKSKETSQILARVRQNIFLCNKNKVKMTFISAKPQKDQHDLKALGLALGMPTWMFTQFN